MNTCCINHMNCYYSITPPPFPQQLKQTICWRFHTIWFNSVMNNRCSACAFFCFFLCYSIAYCRLALLNIGFL